GWRDFRRVCMMRHPLQMAGISTFDLFFVRMIGWRPAMRQHLYEIAYFRVFPDHSFQLADLFPGCRASYSSAKQKPNAFRCAHFMGFSFKQEMLPKTPDLPAKAIPTMYNFE